jgi:hypothetical protein
MFAPGVAKSFGSSEFAEYHSSDGLRIFEQTPYLCRFGWKRPQVSDRYHPVIVGTPHADFGLLRLEIIDDQNSTGHKSSLKGSCCYVTVSSGVVTEQYPQGRDTLLAGAV